MLYFNLSINLYRCGTIAQKLGQDESRRAELRKRAENYMNRAEFIKKHVENEKEAGKYHEKIEICENSKGNSYKKILGRFLDEYVTKVVVEDPYVRNVHQVDWQNSFSFC